MTTSGIDVISSLVTVVVSFAFVLVMVFYLMRDGPSLTQSVIASTPESYRGDVERLMVEPGPDLERVPARPVDARVGGRDRDVSHGIGACCRSRWCLACWPVFSSSSPHRADAVRCSRDIFAC